MADQFKWPDLSDNYPEVVQDDGQLEFKKKLYEQKLEIIKNAQLARIAQDRAKGDAWIAQEKAALDAQIAQARARLDSELRRAEMKLQAEIDAEAAKSATIAEQNRAVWVNEYAISQAYQAAYIDIARKQQERAASRAEFVQKAAALLGGIYTGILALTLVVNVAAKQSAGTGGDMLLPARGIAPTLFLGLAIVLAAAYAANATEPGNLPNSEAAGGTIDAWQRARRNTFIAWTASSNRLKRYLLQAATLSLGAGVGFLPVAYLAVSDSDVLVWAVLALGAVFLLPFLALLAGWVMGKDSDREM